MVKSAKSHERFLFARCSVSSGGRVWFLVQDGSTFRMLQLNESKWIQKSLPWDAVGICGRTDPLMELFIVGANGEAMRGTKEGFSEERLDPGRNLPAKLGIIRDARLVAGVAHAAGMGRQVYRRNEGGVWNLISEQIIPKGPSLLGFNSVDGTSVDDLLAVGLEGDIWRFDGATWFDLESPTNVSLNRVRFVSANSAFACGQSGMLVHIADSRVEVLASNEISHNLSGLAWFKGALYVAGQTALFKLVDKHLVAIDMGLGEGMTSGFLETDGTTLWSVGARHVASSSNGDAWDLLTCPL